MKIIYKAAAFYLLMLVAGCRARNSETESEIVPYSDVQVTHPVIRDATITSEFQGITRYTQTIEIRAHVTGIITKVHISLSDKVSSKQVLFEIRPREASVLESLNITNKYIKSAADTVHAFSSGIVNQIAVQPGDFVQEGDLLATCVDQNSLRAVVYIPLEMNIVSMHNLSCSVLLPDGKTLSGIIGAALPAANEADQTNAFLVKLSESNALPENIHVKVLVKTGTVKQGLFVPYTALYGNEELSRFWVLKIMDDSMAVRIPVEKGITVDTLVQITGSDINTSDPIVYQGGYALPDSSFVTIVLSR
jgi:hypothetical protein